MAVALDTAGTKLVSAGGVTTAIYTGVNVGSGANRALIALCNLSASSPSPAPVSAHWDSAGTNQAMTLLTTIDGSVVSSPWAYVAIFELLAPTPGNGLNLKVDWNAGAAMQLKMVAMSFTGVNQSGGVSSFTTTTNSGTSATDTITQSSATGNYVAAAHSAASNAPNINSIDPTSLFTDSTGSVSSGADYATGATNVTLTATYSSSVPWVAAAVNVIAAGAAAGGLRFNSNMDGLGASGAFFRDPLAGKRSLGWRQGQTFLSRRRGIYRERPALILPKPRTIHRIAA